MRYARLAICQLEDIQRTHYDRDKAFDMVLEWIDKTRVKSQKSISDAMHFAMIAISQLERIRIDDPDRINAFNRVIDSINKSCPEIQSKK